MVDLNPVKVYKAGTGQVAAQPVQFTMFGLVGPGPGTYSNQVRGPYSALAEILTDFPQADSLRGGWGLYRAAYDYFANGGRELYIVEYDLEDEVNASYDGADNKEVDVSGDITLQMEAGSVKVEVDNTAKDGTALVQLEENVDYVVDYSNGKVCLKVAAATGTSNVKVTWQEVTSANMEAALSQIETVTVNVVAAAYQFNSTLVGKLKTHCVTAASGGKPRITFINGQWLDATDILTTATTLDSTRVALFANRCGYYDATATDPSANWLEFKDFAVAMGGVACSNYPWESMHFKGVTGINWHGQYNSTDMQSLLDAYINVAFDPDWLLGEGVVCNQGWTIDSTREFPWIDEIRTYDYIDNLIKSQLTNPAIVGHVKLGSPTDIAVVRGKLLTVQSALFAAGAIYNPDNLRGRYGVDPVVFPLYDALLAAQQNNATELQKQTIQDAEDARHTTVYFAYRQNMSLHTIDVYVTPL